jgi:hypothetical protein
VYVRLPPSLRMSSKGCTAAKLRQKPCKGTRRISGGRVVDGVSWGKKRLSEHAASLASLAWSKWIRPRPRRVPVPNGFAIIIPYLS